MTEIWLNTDYKRGLRDRDRMVVTFTTTCVFSSYHHYCCEFESRPGDVYSIQHYMIKIVSDWQQVGGFIRILRFLLWHKSKDNSRLIIYRVYNHTQTTAVQVFV
jgi:hypothetical protein